MLCVTRLPPRIRARRSRTMSRGLAGVRCVRMACTGLRRRRLLANCPFGSHTACSARPPPDIMRGAGCSARDASGRGIASRASIPCFIPCASPGVLSGPLCSSLTRAHRSVSSQASLTPLGSPGIEAGTIAASCKDDADAMFSDRRTKPLLRRTSPRSSEVSRRSPAA